MTAMYLVEGDWIAEQYRIVRYMTQGGMGAIYEAEDHGPPGAHREGDEASARHRVVVKTILPARANDADLVTRFEREARIGGRIDHENVCHTHASGYHPIDLPDGSRRNLIFLVMPFLEGKTLAAFIEEKRRPLTIAETLPLLRQMANGLAAIHKADAVHRDFKSSNVMLIHEGGGLRAVILDFGIARLTGYDSPDAETEPKATADGEFPGTRAFMAPEQFTSEPVTQRVDVYAFGVVLYKMLTNQLPFIDSNVYQLVMRKASEPPPAPDTYVPSLRGAWSTFLLRCLERDPEKRFQSIRELLEAVPVAAAPPRPITVATDVPAPARVVVGLSQLTAIFEQGLKAIVVGGATASGKSELIAGYQRADSRLRGRAHMLMSRSYDRLGGTAPGEVWYQVAGRRRVFVDPAGEFFTRISPLFRSRLQLPELTEADFDFIRNSVRQLAGIILTVDLTQRRDGAAETSWRDQEFDLQFLLAALRWLRFDGARRSPEISIDAAIAHRVVWLPKIDVPVLVAFTKADLLGPYTDFNPLEFAQQRLPLLHGALLTHARRYRYDFCHTMIRTADGDRPAESPCGVLLPFEWLLDPPLGWVPRMPTLRAMR